MDSLYHVNARAAAVQPSATLAMTAKAGELKRAGRPIVGLSAGEPDFVTPEPICEAARRAIDEGWTHYTDNAGLPELREAVAEKLRRTNGLDVTAAQVVLSNGAKQSVAQAILATVDDGDEVVLIAPYWVSYPEQVRMAGGVPVVVSTRSEDGYVLRAEDLEAALTPKTRLVVLNSPSNPTGAVYPRETLEQVAEVLRRHPNVLVLSDEIYEDVIYDAEHVSIGSLDGMAERTITVNGFSKGYAMTGWRLGYLVGPTPVVKTCARLQSQLTSGPSTISQKAGVAALAMDRRYVDEMVAAFRRRRDLLLGRLAALDGVVLPRPEGAFYLYPDVSGLFGRTAPSGRLIESADELAYYLLEEHDLALVPGEGFGDPNGIRLSYAASDEVLSEAADRFVRAVTALS